MNDISDLVVGLVALNGGELVSKIRLQKAFYLLEECGLESELEFEYHYYGPYSEDLAQGADEAEILNRLKAEPRPGRHSVPYVVYLTEEGAPDRLGALEAEEVREKLAAMRQYSSPELEVAATILFLEQAGYGDDAVRETKSHKPVTATDKRVERAQDLIRELGLKSA